LIDTGSATTIISTEAAIGLKKILADLRLELDGSGVSAGQTAAIQLETADTYAVLPPSDSNYGSETSGVDTTR